MINEVLYDDILQLIFERIPCIYIRCVVLVCKRWKDVMTKRLFYTKCQRIFHFSIQERLDEMTLTCAKFLLEFNRHDDDSIRFTDLRQLVLERKIKELYDVLFFGKNRFFLPVSLSGWVFMPQLEEIEYEKFCERFGVDPNEEEDEEYLPKKRKIKK